MRWVFSGVLVAFCMCAAIVANAGEFTVVIKDDGTASDGTEGVQMWDTYGRSSGNGLFRGRYGPKLYVENGQKAEGSYHISGLKFLDLKNWLGENKKILSAKLELECCNAQNNKGNPVNVVAYPLLDEWNWQGFSWVNKRSASGKETWNKAPAPTHFNVKPAADVSASADINDIAKSAGGKNITANGVMAGTSDTNISLGESVTFDITEMVRLWYSGKLANNGLALLAPNAGTYVRFYSSNSDSFPPSLIIKVQGDSVPAAPAASKPTTKAPAAPPPMLGAPPPSMPSAPPRPSTPTAIPIL